MDLHTQEALFDEMEKIAARTRLGFRGLRRMSSARLFRKYVNSPAFNRFRKPEAYRDLRASRTVRWARPTK